MIKTSIILYLLLLNSLFADVGETLHLESGVNRNTLIELFTSEGCSSCPPAEEFLNSIKNRKDIWKKWIPVAFHVDYWDYIGWKDPYAMKKYGERQSRYASLQRAATVYTPAFMVNGKGWRRGIFSSSLPDETSSAGNLVLSVKNKNIHATYQTKIKSSLKLNIAVLGMDLTSAIERGENEGRTARHEFVVVGFNSTTSNDLSWNTKLPELHYTKSKKYAVAVWVSAVNNPTPLQVVGGLLPGFNK
ncbi:MAG: hypothetical protein BMS9Abin31_0580 [Gammaproteobacteria bacterium]|nr:MAG: hypothetical protein BMS9Abin31_0580 [Gammaproteobacteria bacterium]